MSIAMSSSKVDGIAQWLLVETAAVMSSDTILWRRANIARGFPETVSSKIMHSKKHI